MNDTTVHSSCRGWPLVRSVARLSPPERVAADGHLALCRRCRGGLEAQRALHQKMAAAGSATLGTAIAAVVARSLRGATATSSLGAPAAALPIAALTTAVAVAAGVGGLVAAERATHSSPAGRHVVTSVPATATTSHGRQPAGEPSATTATTTGPLPQTTNGGGALPSVSPSSTSLVVSVPALPAGSTDPLATLPLSTDTTAPALPLSPLSPLPTSSLTTTPLPVLSTSPLPLPTSSLSTLTTTTSSPLPLPLSTSLPPLLP